MTPRLTICSHDPTTGETGATRRCQPWVAGVYCCCWERGTGLGISNITSRTGEYHESWDFVIVESYLVDGAGGAVVLCPRWKIQEIGKKLCTLNKGGVSMFALSGPTITPYT